MPQLIGLSFQYNKLFDWLQDFKHESKKAFILRGTPGIGKTFLANYIASELNYHLIEFNASDERKKEFTQRLKAIVTQRTLSSEGTIVLLDEVDGYSDKAGLKEVITITQKPIILTCNDVNKIQGIRKLCKEMYIPKPDFSDVDFTIQDYRQAALMKQGSQGYTAKPTRKNKILKMIKDGNYEDIDMIDLIMLLDSSPQLYGWEAYQFVKSLACFDYCKRSECLTGLMPKITEVTEVWFSKKRYAKK